MQEKNDLEFPVLSDVGNIVAGQYNLVFTLPDYIAELYKQFGSNLTTYNGEESWTLPVPATFVVDQGKTIRLAYVNPDYTKRADPTDIIRAVQALKN